MSSSIQKWMQGASPQEDEIIFFDPPYEDHTLYKDVGLRLLENRGQREVWIESDKQKGLKEEFWKNAGFEPDKIYSQGTSYLAIFRS